MTTNKIVEKSLKSRLVAAVTQRSADPPPSSKRERALNTESPKVVASKSAKPPAAAEVKAQIEVPKPRSKPGQPAAAKKFIEKKPTARVVGATLLEELYKNNQVAKLLAGGAAEDSEAAQGITPSDGGDTEVLDSVANENRCFTLLRSSLRYAQKTHRVPRINKHVTFYGSDGGECTHIYFYEVVKIKLPWTGPKFDRAKDGVKDASGEWLRREWLKSTSAASARPRPLL